jgi:phosphopantothenoylcysteine synthetase/decarboxylase
MEIIAPNRSMGRTTTSMNFLVTAGNTLTLIDRVRCITNIFTGRTGAAIAIEARRRRHSVHLLTSHPETVAALVDGNPLAGAGWVVQRYRTFEELRDCLREAVTTLPIDAVVHCAAVNDYLNAGVYVPASGTCFDPTTSQWTGDPPTLLDRAAGKIRSDAPELWLRLVRAPKLIDQFRDDWKFNGVLVKFKLEVERTDQELLDIAEQSRCQSRADLMVANTLEGADEYAYLGAGQGGYQRVTRRELPTALIEQIEQLHELRRGE